MNIIITQADNPIPFLSSEMAKLKWMHENYDEKTEIWVNLPHCDICGTVLTCPNSTIRKHCFGCYKAVSKYTLVPTLLRRVDLCRKKRKVGSARLAPPKKAQKDLSSTHLADPFFLQKQDG